MMETSRALERSRPPQAENDLRDHALAYAQGDWPVFPVRRRGKDPMTPHGVNDATTDADAIQGWWARWPTANIGLAVPTGFAVVDVDSAEALQRLKADDLVLPTTARARTAHGWHHWYETNGAPASNRVGILPGVDIRAVGGYVVVPPSIHPSGALYRWEVRLSRTVISDCPEWVLKMLSEPDAPRGSTPEQWLEIISQRVPEGRRNQTLAQVAGLLFCRLPARVAAELAYCWAQTKMDPPLPHREIQRTLDSIAARELRRRGGTA